MSELVTIPAKTGRRLTCKCGYTWVYAGKHTRFGCCPACHTTVTFDYKSKKSIAAAGDRNQTK
ncbi:MAG: hypothetical protein ACJ708_11350 [Nitrososphaeraceae archaeon]